MTQDRLVTSWNCRPMVGSAVATMVWSSAARNIVSNRLIRMVRTSPGVSGALGASGGAGGKQRAERGGADWAGGRGRLGRQRRPLADIDPLRRQSRQRVRD